MSATGSNRCKAANAALCQADAAEDDQLVDRHGQFGVEVPHRESREGHRGRQQGLCGPGTFARLQSDAAFRADVAAASVELAAARTQGQAPDRDCAAEAAALAIPLPGVL